MNCNIFKKRLEEYVLGNISNDLRIALDKHMEECESCRRLYEEEIKIDTAFKTVLSIDGIEFSSSRTSIINSIDKNRYSKKKSNKMLYNFKKYKSRYLTYAVATVAIAVLIPMMIRDFGEGSYNNEMAKKNTAMYKLADENALKGKETSDGASMKSSSKTDKTEIGSLAKVEERKVVSNVEENVLLEFQRSTITKQDIPSNDIKWENFPDGKSSAVIDVRPEGDVDFGIHLIYIKNTTTNEIVKYEVINNERQYTPRNIEWWDNEHLIIVAGLGYGTIEYGSEVYSLDVNSGKLSSLYQRKDKKYQILDVKKVKNDLILQLLIYDDATYNAFHSGVGKMTLLELDKPVDMEIQIEEKK
jgi:hypothetical protein